MYSKSFYGKSGEFSTVESGENSAAVYKSRGRGKIENYHRSLYRELISLKEFKSLSHFRREFWRFDRQYNSWRKQEALGWQTPASIYNDERYFNNDWQNAKKLT